MWSLILKQLPLILLATALAWMTHLYLGQRDATTACQVTRDSEIQAAEAQRAEAQVRNKESLGKLNRDHAKKRACPSDEAVGQLLVNCATDAFSLSEWQRWATINRLPVAEP